MRKKSFLLFITLLSMYPTLFAQQQEMKFSASEVKSDLDYLYSTLEQSHFNLYAYVSKNKFDNAYKSSIKSLGKDSLSLLEATKLFQQFTAIGNVGHSEIDFPAQSYITYATQGGVVFPVELAFEEGKAFIRKSYTDNSAIQAGAQVVSIDKTSIKEIQSQLHPYISAERPYFKNVKLEFWSFPRYYWLVYGRKDVFTVEVKSNKGKVEKHIIKAIPIMEYESRRGGEILTSERSLTYYPNTAYINPGPFSSVNPTEGETKYKQFIDSAFADIKARKVNNLIIDLRNNTGGHNAYSDYLISYFADKPFRWYSNFKIKTSEALKEQTYKKKFFRI